MLQKTKILLLLLFTFLVHAVQAQIAFDASSTEAEWNASSVSFSHTCTGDNLILIVGLTLDDEDSVTALTYNGVSLTKIARKVEWPVSSEMWYLVNPATGSNTIAVTFSGSTSWSIGAASYTGVDQDTPLGTAVKASGNSSSPSVTASSAADELVIDHLGTNGSETYSSVGANQTIRYNGTGTFGEKAVQSSEAGAASVTMSHTLTSTDYWMLIAVPLKPAPTCTEGEWEGDVSTDWNTAGNWGCDTKPTSSIDVEIPSGTTYAPTVGAFNAVCQNLTINSGATLTFSNTNATYDFDVHGNINISGTLNHTGDQPLELNGASKTIAASGTLTNVKLELLTGSSYTANTNLDLDKLTLSGTGSLTVADRSAASSGTATVGSGNNTSEAGSPFMVDDGSEIIWLEDFSGSSDGATSDTGPTSWTIDATNVSGGAAGKFDVRSNKFETNNTSGAGIWKSDYLDISGYSSVDMSVALTESGTLESTDTVSVFYKKNGAATHNVFTTNGQMADDFTSATASVSGVSGDSAQLWIYGRNGASDEYIQWDDVTIKHTTGTTGYKQMRWQAIWTADELTSDGVPGSGKDTISSLQFNTTGTANTRTLKIMIGHTSSSSFSSSFLSPTWTTVYDFNDVSMSSGWNTFTFDNDFIWNGSDNVVIQVCWYYASDRDGVNVYTDLAPGKVAYKTSSTSSSDCSLTSPRVCGNRPQIKLGYAAPRVGYTLNASGNVTVGASATFSASDTIILDGSAAQNITTNGTSLTNLVINNSYGTAPQVTLQDALTLSGMLTLTDGVVDIGNYNLTIGSSGSISGGSSSTFIATTGTGLLRQEGIGSGSRTGAILFPVGSTTSSYTPVTIDNSTGTSDRFDVKVCNGVYNDGNCSGGSQYTEDVINKTWTINEGVATGSDASITLQWNASDEASGYDRANCRMSHYNGSGWEYLHVDGAASGSDPYTRTATGVTDFSPFGMGGGGGNPLPIELTEFTAELIEGAVFLKWQTLTEINNDYFTIERSADAIQFEEIETITGAGNSHEEKNYSMVDHYPLSGVSYYRLKQTDYDGSFEYSDIVVVKHDRPQDKLAVKMSPNPSDGRIKLDVSGVYNDNVSIAVYNPYGEELYFESWFMTGATALIIDLSENLASGTYIVTAESGSSLWSEKLIVR